MNDYTAIVTEVDALPIEEVMQKLLTVGDLSVHRYVYNDGNDWLYYGYLEIYMSKKLELGVSHVSGGYSESVSGAIRLLAYWLEDQ